MKKNSISPIYFFLILLAPLVVVVYLFKVIIKRKGIVNSTVELPEYDFVPDEVVAPNGLNPRQMQIIDYMRGNGGNGRVSDMVKLFSQTDRTLRRDLNKLEGLGVVRRSGSTKSVSYSLAK